MADKWRSSTWGEEISLEYGKSLKNYRGSDGKIQVFGSKGAVGWTDKALSDGPGVILGRKGAYRGVRYSHAPFFVIDTAYYVKAKADHNMRWLYYSIIHHKLGEIDDGSPIPSTTRSAVYVTDVDVPPLPEQKAIAHILGSLDDKIELNRRMNATLEGMAQALFKSWFVDFDPVIDNALVAGNPIPDEFADCAEVRRQALANGTANREAAKLFPAAFQQIESMSWIPEGWELGKLSDLLEIKYGKDHKNLNEGSIPVYGSGGLMRYADTSLYSGESVLIPRKGTLSNILYLNEEFWTVDTMFYTIPKIDNAPKYSFYHLKSLDFVSMNVGSAVPSMTTKVLNDLPIVLPDANVLQQFDTILTSYFLKTEANNHQNQSLIKLRHTLLPKLISGELRIPDDQKLAEEALA
jgi:type I restriction enzyme S subunit